MSNPYREQTVKNTLLAYYYVTVALKTKIDSEIIFNDDVLFINNVEFLYPIDANLLRYFLTRDNIHYEVKKKNFII